MWVAWRAELLVSVKVERTVECLERVKVSSTVGCWVGLKAVLKVERKVVS